MGEMAVTETQSTNDLLTLIGTAIEQLMQSIELFETSSQTEGIGCLSAVIDEIDTYIDCAHDDPLLRIARIDVSNLESDLQHIKTDLFAVIDQVDKTAATS